MMGVAVAWLLANPLQGVAALAAVAVAVGLLLVPARHEFSSHNHPRL